MNDTEKNIGNMINSGFNKEYQLNEQLKEDTLNLLLQKVAQRKKVVHYETKFAVAFSVVWFAIIVFVISEISVSIYLFDTIKLALGLSLFFVPVSSIILIILKKRTHETSMTID